MAGKKPLPATSALKAELAAVADAAVAVNAAMLQVRTALGELKEAAGRISMAADRMAATSVAETVRPQRLLLTATEVGEVLALSESTVWRRARDGGLPKPVKLAGATRWRWQDLADAVARLHLGTGDSADEDVQPEEECPSCRRGRRRRT